MLGLAVLGLGLGNGLIGPCDLLFQCIQAGILEDLPPLAGEDMITRMRLLPALEFLEVIRNGGVWPLIGAYRTAGQPR
jgi:hypothetical protein